MNKYQQFIEQAVAKLGAEPLVTGLAVGGSWINNEMDDFSDLDLVLVTENKISTKDEMVAMAGKAGDLLSAFTGEHVGEPRLLICLYNPPLLHVDIKFLTLEEFNERVEDPVIVLDKHGQLAKVVQQTIAQFPYPGYQWIEDRFWTWVHYALLKIGRGEYMEAYDFLGYLRMVVFGPLLHIKNDNLPRGVRKVETKLPSEDLKSLQLTLAVYSQASLVTAIEHAVALYRQLRNMVFSADIHNNTAAEEAVMKYLEEMKVSF